MTYIEINGTLHEAYIHGYTRDKDWDDRESKAITLAMTYADAMNLFVDGLEWSIVYTEGETNEIYDNSDFSIAGSVTDNRNGTVTVKMGKPTEVERILMNVITEEELKERLNK